MKRKVLKSISLLFILVFMVSLVAGCAKPETPKVQDQENTVQSNDANGQEQADDQDDQGKSESPEDLNNSGETGNFSPVEITDSLGRTIVIENQPQKVISIAPNTTETLFALGLGDKVIGVSQQCDYPEEAVAKDKMGDFWQPNIELIVAADPDLLFVGNAAPQEFLEKMDENDIVTIALEGFNLEGTYQSILDTGKAMGTEDAAAYLVDSMKKKVVEIQEKTDGIDRLKGYFAISYGDMGDYTAGAGSFIDELITLAGGENIAGDMDEPWAEYSIEKLLEKDPDVIFIGEQSMPDGLADAPGYKELRAVKEGQIIILDDNIVMRAGPRIVEGLEEMAKGMYPEAFN
ncbi:MAG: ABC transporter substrate-binding protein [Clostridiales bacterium]|nr:ABC transporter substrate-binding protein [Clostridiales bacterium]